MNTKSLASLVLLATLTPTLPAWALTKTWSELTSPLTEDTTVTGCDSITVNDTIDLAGHKLYLEGLTGLSGSGAFTDSTTDKANPGELHLILSDDISASTVGLTGNMRLVKSGTKTLEMANKTTSYTGGNIISNGTLKIGTTTQTLANFKPLGKAGGYVVVCRGGTFDVNAKYGFKGVYDVTLSGGTVVNLAQRDNTSAFNPALTLTANSTFSNSGSNKTYGFAAEGALNDYTLTVEVKSLLYWQPTIENGTVKITGTKELRVSANTDMQTVHLDESGAILNLDGKTLSVSNYVSNLSSARTATTGNLNVYGALIPNTDYFFPPTMQNGSTIDLSAKEGTWVSTVEGAIEAIKYAENATVNINVGSRTVKEGDKLIAWNKSDLSGLSFKLVGENVTEDLSLTIDQTGISVISSDTQVTDALWTGAGNDGDINNTANWKCTTAGGKVIADTLPDGNIVVTIPYNKLKEINCSPDAPLTCKRLDFKGEKPTEAELLPADRDWRGLGDIDFLFPIDLNGHDLKISLKGKTMEDATPSVTNSSPTAATLFVSVPAGETYDNQSVAFGGNLTFVKEGAGKFVAALCPQEYAGTTIVSNGVLCCAKDDNMNAPASKSPFGANRTVTVGPNGILDPAGSYYWGNHTVNLDGGMISNTVARAGVGDSYNSNLTEQFNPVLNLSAPSVFATAQTFNFEGKLNSNGHKLKVWIASGKTLLWYSGEPIVGADVEVVNGGYFRTVSHGPVNMAKSNLTMSSAGLFIGGVLSVSNYVAASAVNNYKYDDRKAKGESLALLKVYGTFKPVTDYFFGCTMQNGSAIDLSEQTGSWSVATKATATATTGSYIAYKSTVDFAAGATVTIDVHGRTFKGREQIVEWAQGSTNGLETVTFKLDAASKAAGYSLFYKPYVDDSNKGGLWVGRKGLVFVVQ